MVRIHFEDVTLEVHFIPRPTVTDIKVHLEERRETGYLHRVYMRLFDHDDRPLQDDEPVSNHQSLRLRIGVLDGDEIVFIAEDLLVVNGNIVCPEQDVYPENGYPWLTSKVHRGPERMRRAMEAAASKRFIALLQEYREDDRVMNAIDEYGYTWLHLLCSGYSSLGLGYKHDKESWLKMTEAFISTVDVSWMLKQEDEEGQTPIDLARKCGRRMLKLLTS